jgi:hypothetical protein
MDNIWTHYVTNTTKYQYIEMNQNGFGQAYEFLLHIIGVITYGGCILPHI